MTIVTIEEAQTHLPKLILLLLLCLQSLPISLYPMPRTPA